MKYVWLILLFLFSFVDNVYAAAPHLITSNILSCDNNNWPGDNTKGGVVTIYGTNLGSSGSLSCGGQTLTSTDSEVVEWGATINPTTPTVLGVSRISFWIISNMSTGDTGIMVTVDGEASNELDFDIVDTGNIYRWPTDASSQGWGTIEEASEDMSAGDILYIRAGSYDYSDDWADGAYAEIGGYPAPYGSTPCVDGTSASRIVITGYPGENVIVTEDGGTNEGEPVKQWCEYWTISNITFGNRVYLSWGTQNTFTVDIDDSNGLRVIGCAFYGYSDHAIQMFSHNSEIMAIYCNRIPYDDTSYNFYLCAGDTRTVSWNHISGGSRWQIHMFDEDRPNNDSDKSMDGHVIENNYVDCSNSGEGTRGCLLMQADYYATVGENINNAIVRNNVFFTTDNALTENFIRIRRSVNNAVFYNNTFYSGAEGISIDFHSPQPTNVTIKNNIFDTISGYEVDDGTSNGVSTLNYNLYNSNANLDGCTKGTNAKENKDPKFVSDGSDFSLQSDSDAIDAGDATLGVSMDILSVPRPQGDGVDIGAFEMDEGGGQYSDPDSTPNDSSGGACFIGMLF